MPLGRYKQITLGGQRLKKSYLIVDVTVGDEVQVQSGAWDSAVPLAWGWERYR